MFKTETLNLINDWINNSTDSEIADKAIKCEILNQSVVVTTQSLSMVIRCITKIVMELTIKSNAPKGDLKSLMMLTLINQSLKVLPGRDGIYISF